MVLSPAEYKEMFQSRKQDYFNWKLTDKINQAIKAMFQSRKQDYFNWKG